MQSKQVAYGVSEVLSLASVNNLLSSVEAEVKMARYSEGPP